MSRRLLYIATEKDPLYLHALQNRFLRTPNVPVRRLDPGNPADFEAVPEQVETVLCLNVLEYVPDPAGTLSATRECLQPGGGLLVLVPQGKKLFGTLDETMGHRRRFEESELRDLLVRCGFEIIRIHQLNKFGTPAWALHGRMLRHRHINKLTLKVFDKTVWLWRRLDGVLPWHGLSLIAVARRRD